MTKIIDYIGPVLLALAVLGYLAKLSQQFPF